jgi:hypothetical protein
MQGQSGEEPNAALASPDVPTRRIAGIAASIMREMRVIFSYRLNDRHPAAYFTLKVAFVPLSSSPSATSS